jgi:two-component system NtrC family sensor kinase
MIHVINNAVDAIDHDGRVMIRTLYNEDEKKIHVDVDDNGVGMSPEVLKRVFHPFFTTKPVGSGTGIGLTLTDNIIKRHHGEIDISTREGVGTTVHIVLPVGAGPSCEGDSAVSSRIPF